MAPECHNFVNTPGDLEGVIVPQKVYQGTASIHNPRPDIRFFAHGEVGVSLELAARAGFCSNSGMDDGETRPPIDANAIKTTIRIEWPGYRSFSTSIAIQVNLQGESQIVTKAKLAQAVARAVKKFFESPEHTRFIPPEDFKQWSLSKVKFDKLFLYELRHVSPGSYQPVLLWRL
ncbi:hypothetical protein BC835DRAFT_61314 [Cytidiella melzeri]|nr:hypothetical protein BC835DRAFT_61314 [Cytidiella melzeri]